MALWLWVELRYGWQVFAAQAGPIPFGPERAGDCPVNAILDLLIGRNAAEFDSSKKV
jgi:hypothetical protein